MLHFGDGHGCLTIQGHMGYTGAVPHLQLYSEFLGSRQPLSQYVISFITNIPLFASRARSRGGSSFLAGAAASAARAAAAAGLLPLAMLAGAAAAASVGAAGCGAARICGWAK